MVVKFDERHLGLARIRELECLLKAEFLVEATGFLVVTYAKSHMCDTGELGALRFERQCTQESNSKYCRCPSSQGRFLPKKDAAILISSRSSISRLHSGREWFRSLGPGRRSSLAAAWQTIESLLPRCQTIKIEIETQSD